MSSPIPLPKLAQEEGRGAPDSCRGDLRAWFSVYTAVSPGNDRDVLSPTPNPRPVVGSADHCDVTNAELGTCVHNQLFQESRKENGQVLLLSRNVRFLKSNMLAKLCVKNHRTYKEMQGGHNIQTLY